MGWSNNRLSLAQNIHASDVCRLFWHTQYPARIGGIPSTTVHAELFTAVSCLNKSFAN
jgi:hypothetical protein